MADPVTTTLTAKLVKLLGQVMSVYYAGNLGKTLVQKPLQKVDSEVIKAEQSALKHIHEALSAIANELKGEKVADWLGCLSKLTDALILGARAHFHVRIGGWCPESSDMILTFLAEKPGLRLPSPDEAGRAAKATPRQQVSDILKAKSNAALLGNAKIYSITFNEMCRLLEEYFNLGYTEREEKSGGASRQSVLRREIRRSKKAIKSKLKDLQTRLVKMHNLLNSRDPVEVRQKIAEHIRTRYDGQIRTCAKELSTSFGLSRAGKARILSDSWGGYVGPLDLVNRPLRELFQGYYAVVYKRWHKAVCGQIIYPRWRRMRKKGPSTGDGLAEIWSPTEIVSRGIADWLEKQRSMETIRLITELEVQVQALSGHGQQVKALEGNVIVLGQELWQQLDDAIEVVKAELEELSNSGLPADQGGAAREDLTRLLTVFEKVKALAHTRAEDRRAKKSAKEKKDADKPTSGNGTHTRRNLQNEKQRR